MTSHVEYRGKFLTLYKYEFLVTLQMRYKVVRVHLSSKRIIFIRLEKGYYKWYQSRSSTSVWGFVWPCEGCLSIWPYNLIGYNGDVISA